MQINNYRSHHPDAYLRLEETPTEAEGSQPARPASPASDASPEPDHPQQSNRHSVEQAEARGRYLAEQAEAYARQPVYADCTGTVRPYGARAIPYPQDKALIKRFCEGAGAGNSNANTVSFYRYRLNSISDYLRRRQLPAISARLFSPELDNDIQQYDRDNDRREGPAILKHLRSIESSKQGVTTIPTYRSMGLLTDRWLIEQAFSKDRHKHTVIAYQSSLHALSAWLAEKGKPALCDPDHLHSVELAADVHEFSRTHHRPKCIPALQQLRNYDQLGKVQIVKRLDTSIIPAEDRDLIARYKEVYNEALVLKARDAGKPVHRDTNGRTSVDKYASTLRSFSAWLQQQNRGSMASLLHDPLLDSYKDIWTHNKSASYARTSTYMLKQLRAMPVPNSSQPAAKSRHSTLALPDSDGAGRGLQQEVTGPVRRTEAAASDSLFGDLSPINSLSYQKISEPAAQQEVTGPARRTEAAASDSVFGNLSSLNSLSYQEVSGPAAQHDIMAVDSYQSPPQAAGVAERLTSDPWLCDNDLVGYTRHIAAQLQGQPRADLLHFVDPQQVRLLTEGNQQLRNEVLAHLTGPATPPILLMPVNHNNQHWSLLCVNRQSGQAFHYDSMVSPETAHLATHTAQFGAASRVAGALGVVGAPAAVPIARQPDTQSCGDHVLCAMEELAQRTVSGEIFQLRGLDLSAIRPSRQHIVAVLTQNGAVS